MSNTVWSKEMTEYYSYGEMLHELETRAEERYIEKYSKKKFKEELEEGYYDRMREIVDEFLTKEELLEYIRITYLEQGEQYIFYKLFGDDDR